MALDGLNLNPFQSSMPMSPQLGGIPGQGQEGGFFSSIKQELKQDVGRALGLSGPPVGLAGRSMMGQPGQTGLTGQPPGLMANNGMPSVSQAQNQAATSLGRFMMPASPTTPGMNPLGGF